jgi:hypothetical protein
VFVELVSLEPGKDLGTGGLALKARLEVRIVVDGMVEGAARVLKSLATEVPRVVNKNASFLAPFELPPLDVFSFLFPFLLDAFSAQFPFLASSEPSLLDVFSLLPYFPVLFVSLLLDVFSLLLFCFSYPFY